MEIYKKFLIEEGVKSIGEMRKITEDLNAVAGMLELKGGMGGIEGVCTILEIVRKRRDKKEKDAERYEGKKADNSAGRHIQSEEIEGYGSIDKLIVVKKSEKKLEKDKETIASGDNLKRARAEAEKLIEKATKLRKKKPSDALLEKIAVKKEVVAKGALSAREKNMALTGEFENVFWPEYPTGGKKGKPKALGAFVKARSKVGLPEIMKGLVEYKKFLVNKPDTHVKYAQGWLNDERWNDYVVEKEMSSEKTKEEHYADDLMFRSRLVKKGGGIEAAAMHLSSRYGVDYKKAQEDIEKAIKESEKK